MLHHIFTRVLHFIKQQERKKNSIFFYNSPSRTIPWAYAEIRKQGNLIRATSKRIKSRLQYLFGFSIRSGVCAYVARYIVTGKRDFIGISLFFPIALYMRPPAYARSIFQNSTLNNDEKKKTTTTITTTTYYSSIGVEKGRKKNIAQKAAAAADTRDNI